MTLVVALVVALTVLAIVRLLAFLAAAPRQPRASAADDTPEGVTAEDVRQLYIASFFREEGSA